MLSKIKTESMFHEWVNITLFSILENRVDLDEYWLRIQLDDAMREGALGALGGIEMWGDDERGQHE
jgi:hypothetical protein